MTDKTYDIIIVGAGVIGCAIARELSRYQVSVLILEKENDVSCGASKANSGIVHGGYDAKHGTKKGYYSRRGNRLFEQLNKELHFGYDQCGSLVVAFDQEDMAQLEVLKANGEKNGVDDLVIINQQRLFEMEPHISRQAVGALYCPTAGITSPYELTIAYCENAIANGVALELNQEVISISRREEQDFLIKTKQGDEFFAKRLINCAGAYSDKVANMVGIYDFHIIPRRGEYILLNKDQGYLSQQVIFQTPTKKGKGILVTKTYHGNLMLGPNAQEVGNPSEIGTNMEILEEIVNKARKSIPDFDLKKTLTSFSGIRATPSTHDFIIEESQVKGFINVAGIESPGITSSPAISLDVVKIVESSGIELFAKKDFNPSRKAIIVKKKADFDGRIDDKRPDKNIICRCEKVTEAEILEAMHRGIPIDSMDAIKRRTRAGMGPCQGAFCGPRVAKLIADERGIEVEQVTWRGPGSSILPKREKKTFWKHFKEVTKE